MQPGAVFPIDAGENIPELVELKDTVAVEIHLAEHPPQLVKAVVVELSCQSGGAQGEKARGVPEAVHIVEDPFHGKTVRDPFFLQLEPWMAKNLVGVQPLDRVAANQASDETFT
mmetsp:Transcript_772/g.1633  ORF Transcript_772/g.1633 Transcript_772/m.1633 type:complete len:114 (-) Transcript_772:17-358(-)